MSLHIYENLEQGSEEWLTARRGLLTASVIGQLITTRHLTAIEYACPDCTAAAGEPCLSKAKAGVDPSPIKTLHPGRTGYASARREDSEPILEVADTDASRALTATLVAERILGWSEPAYFTDDMQRGHEAEPIARDLYSEKYAPVTEVGFMVAEFDGHRLGFSPDGLVGENGLIEVKAPRAKTHLRTILNDAVPAHHMAQIQTGLLVSDREWCEFLSFYGGMPMYRKRVLRDEAWSRVIREALRTFETTASAMQARYAAAAEEFPATERLTFDMEMSF